MKQITTTLVLLLASIATWSQVGIGTTNPNAILDITIDSPSSPSNTDGLLIPRISTFSAINPTLSQNGMLVYLTTTSGTNVPGFYYWNNNSTSWVAINSPKNSMDAAYNQGGAGLGRIITANSGAVEIQGADGLLVASNINIGHQIVHEGDSNTFIQFTPDRTRVTAGGRNYMDIQHANQEIAINEGSTQTDFRIESGHNEHMFFTDGSADAIGINNSTPNALVDIAINDVTAPQTTDGLLIPRMDVFPPGPNGAQNGMLVFITGNGGPTKGVYYWDWDTVSATGSWVSL